MDKEPVIPEVEEVWLDIDKLYADEENPNEEPPEVFAALVEEIRRHGFIDPVRVAKLDEDKWWIVAGEHRVAAAKVVGLQKAKCVIQEFTEDDRKIELVRQNILRGNINPFKFTRLFNRLRKQYDPEYLRSKMGLVSEREWKSLYKDIRKTLPPEIVDKLDKSKEEVEDVESLARIIKRIFADHGEQLKLSLLIFNYGGKDHLMVKMNDRTKKNIDRIVDDCLERKQNINIYMNQLLEMDTKVPNEDK